MKLINFFLVKKAYYVKRQDFTPKIFLENCAFYGLDTELEPELVKNRNRNFNLSKVGTGTAQKCYTSATLLMVTD